MTSGTVALTGAVSGRCEWHTRYTARPDDGKQNDVAVARSWQVCNMYGFMMMCN
jgi:hypothetical protein